MWNLRVLLVLAVSIFYSSFIPFQKSKIIPYRELASSDSCVDMLSNFYSYQSKSFINKRIELNKDVHSFYRAFVPLFYESLTKFPKKTEKLKDLEKFISTIGGDTHFENFGFVVDDNSVAHFLLNDFDDSTEGPLYLDVLRHFVSTHMVTNKMDWKDYKEAYLKGVRGEKREYSKYVQKNIDNSKVETAEKWDLYISSLGKPKFKKLKNPNRPLVDDEVASLQVALKKKFPQIEIFDRYARIKDDGGSAGMMRYEVLVKLTPNTELKWLDIKELGESSYDKVAKTPNELTPANRVKNVLKNLYVEVTSKLTSTIPLLDKTFSIKSADQYMIGVSIDDLSKDQLQDVALDEAYALGSMHAQSLKVTDRLSANYADTWDSIATKDLSDLSDAIESDFNELFKKSK